MSNKQTAPWFAFAMKGAIIVLLCGFSAALGGTLPRVVGASDQSLSYADFVSIMLTAISVLMTVLAIFLAVAAFVGWTTIEQKVQDKTQDILASGLDKGGRLERMILDMLEKKSDQIIYRGVEAVDDAALDDENSPKLTGDRTI